MKFVYGGATTLGFCFFLVLLYRITCLIVIVVVLVDMMAINIDIEILNTGPLNETRSRRYQSYVDGLSQLPVHPSHHINAFLYY